MKRMDTAIVGDSLHGRRNSLGDNLTAVGAFRRDHLVASDKRVLSGRFEIPRREHWLAGATHARRYPSSEASSTSGRLITLLSGVRAVSQINSSVTDMLTST